MEYSELLDIIKTGEGYTIEFKESINSSIGKDQINISPDKVEIINPGKLLFPEEELGKRSVLRNPVLVDLVHRLGLVEKAGSGIKRMQKLAKEDNITVEFKTGMFFEVIFHRKIENRAQNRSKTEANRMKFGHKSDTKTRQRWILDCLKQKGTIKSVDIINRFHIVKDTASRDLKYLIEGDKIVRKGGGNNVWYELKSEEEKL